MPDAPLSRPASLASLPREVLEVLAFYADRRKHQGTGTSAVYRDNGRKAREALGFCPTCALHHDGLGMVKTGYRIMDQDGVYDDWKTCPDCHGAGFEEAPLVH